MTSTEPRTDIFEHRLADADSEALLLDAARAGSTAAFGVLYARHRDHALAIARRALAPADGALAEDVVEAAFIDVFTAIRHGKGPTDTLRFYLVTAVRRQAWRSQRRQRRQADVVDQWSAEQAIAAEPDLTAIDADGLGAHALLTEAFRGLSERWRHVLWLTEVEGRKPADIAPMLGVSAGTASALAYRARRGLLAAYVGAYGDQRTDPVCRALVDRLAEFVAAEPGATGFDDVRSHLEGCASCRDLARGVDVGGVVGAVAPFGLLTLGWWAKAIAAAEGGAGAVAGAGAIAAAGAGGASGAGGAGGTTVGAAGSAGAVGAVAAAVVAAVVVAGAAFGIVRQAEPAAEQQAATTAAPLVRGRTLDRPDGGLVEAPLLGGPAAPLAVPPGDGRTPATSTTTTLATTTAPVGAPRVVPPGPSATISSTTTSLATASTTTTAPPTSTSTTTTLATTTTTLATTSTSAATTSTTLVTTTVAPSTTTTVPEGPVGPGVLAGAVVRTGPEGEVGVAGIRVVASTWGDQRTAITDAQGRWRIDRLPTGLYLVVAEVPAAYRPHTGVDPWLGGPTWSTVLGLVVAGESPVDLVDLRLVDR